MKLHTVTITGASDDTDPMELYRLSLIYPFVEWGILLSSTSKGVKPRYPSNEWVRSLIDVTGARGPAMRLSGHLCGRTMQEFLTGITHEEYNQGWIMQHGLTEREYGDNFQRTQVNFNALTNEITPLKVRNMMDGWYDAFEYNDIITQHNHANYWVWELAQDIEIQSNAHRCHQVLHDASGGRGSSPDKWDKPIAGILNGYAGGMNPDNVIQNIHDIERVVGDGYVWIDMESGARDSNDHLDIPAVEAMLEDIKTEMKRNSW